MSRKIDFPFLKVLEKKDFWLDPFGGRGRGRERFKSAENYKLTMLVRDLILKLGIFLN